MPLYEIKQKILTDAKALADKIAKEAKEEANKQAKEAEKEQKNLKEEAEKEISLLLAEEKRRVISKANQRGRQKINSVRRSILDNAFQKALKKISSLPEQEYKKAMEKLFSQLETKNILSFTVPESKKEESIDFLIQKGVDKNLIKTSKDFTGGFKIVGRDFEYDATFESLIREFKEAKEAEIASSVF